MRRIVSLVTVAVLVAYAAGVATGLRLAFRQLSPPEPETPVIVQTPVASLPEPERGPELFGVIEEIRRPSAGWLRLRLVCRPPERPEQKSPQSEYEGERKSVYYVHVGEKTLIRHRVGKSDELAEQQIVSVWWQGEVATSLPPQIGAEQILIEQLPGWVVP